MIALKLLIYGAILLAMRGAMFGVGMARMIWADDLKNAQNIHNIDKQTIAAQRKTIDLLQQH